MMQKVVSHEVAHLAEKAVPELTMSTLTCTLSNRLKAAPFLHDVLPPLMARMALSLEQGPLGEMRALAGLRDWYAESALVIKALEAPPPSEWRTKPSNTFLRREEEFGSSLEQIRIKGREVRESLVRATMDTTWRGEDIDDFLVNFYERRLTLRLLLGQYAACRKAQSRHVEGHSMDAFLRRRDAAREDSSLLNGYLRSTFDELDLNNDGVLDPEELARARTLYETSDSDEKPTVVGLVDSAMSPFDVAIQAIADVQAECKMSEYRTAPPFSLHGRGKGATLPYLPRHLYKILRDLLRNAAKAQLETGAQTPIKLIISDSVGQNDVVIKCADEAGGMPRSMVRSIFSFAKTATKDVDITSVLADQAICRALGQLDSAKAHPLNSPPAHRVIGTQRLGGHGLPISRLYAKYFNGDLRIRSMDGFGTDAYVYISRVPDDYVLPS